MIGSSYRAVQFYPGHPLEIINLIKEKDSGSLRYEKFPAVCLFLDTLENHGSHQWAYDANNLQIVILYYTEQSYSSAERHVKNFKPVLIPFTEN